MKSCFMVGQNGSFGGRAKEEKCGIYEKKIVN